ncbi:MAG: ABC transporter substrate-binding protein [Deltaproteobacteria bacterium]|nr:ABC transporter substrate-binding protein [Deltaproteobacteria bacterium]
MKTFSYLLWLIWLVVAGGCHSPRTNAGTLVVALEANPTNFDPRFARDIYSDNVNKLVYDGLFRVDRSGRPVPRLVAAYTAETPVSWHMLLRPGVRFHDGTPLTARDVARTFEIILDPDSVSPLRGTFDNIESIEVLGDYEFRFRLKQARASFLSDLTIGIPPAHVAPDTLKRTPVGTGPYRLAGYIPSEKVVLEAVEEGGNWPPPAMRRVVMQVIPNETSRVLGLLHGSVDLAINNITPLYARHLGDKGFQVVTGPGANYTYLAFNLRDPVLKDPRVRQAFAHAIDRDRLVHYRLRGMASVATGYLPGFHWAWRQPSVTYGFDPDRARSLLGEAGYPGGIEVEWKTSTNKEALRNIEVMQESLAAVGIRVKVKSYEWAALFDQIVRGDFQVFTLSWVAIADPDMMYSIFHSRETPDRGGKNRGYYSSPEVDRLLEDARTEIDPERRAGLYGEVQEITARDLPYVPLFWRDNIAVAQPGIRGVEPDPAASFWMIENIRKEAR